MTAAAAVSREFANVGSPVATLRLLAAAGTPPAQLLEDPEQLPLPFEWSWTFPSKVAPAPPSIVKRPDPGTWGGRILLAAFEIMLGRRPAGQLARHIDAPTAAVLAMHSSRYDLARRRGRPQQQAHPRITSVHTFQPHDDAAEISAVVHDGERFRAVAIRLNARGAQWITTAFEMA